MDATTKAIAEALRQWHEAPKAEVIDFAEAKRRLERKRWLRIHTKPMRPTPPEAA